MTKETRIHRVYLLYVLVAALGVFVFAHREAIKSPYVINDDVRQQIYWMNQWQDNELYQDDILTQYARNYVPWGVQAIYWAASHVIDPVQFTKVLAGLLFVVTAVFFFGLGLEFRDDLTAILIVCVFFLFGHFLWRISGGLARGFAYPLLVGYLFFLARNNLLGASVMMLLQSLFIPYIFLLCMVTHVIFIFHNKGRTFLNWMKGNRLSGAFQGPENAVTNEPEVTPTRPLIMLLTTIPAGVGLFMMALRYVIFKSPVFGELVTRAEMAGKIEYTTAGRFEIMPAPSFFSGLIRLWEINLPFREWGPVAGCISAVILVVAVVYACTKYKESLPLKSFRVFAYLLAASVLVYILSQVFLMKLFVPWRYMEFSLNIFFCVATAICIRIAIEGLGLRRIAFPLLTTLLVLLGALRLNNVGIYDYSDHAPLYRFLETTPKNTLISGHPDIMDNVLTFSHRRAFITYELSHTWVKPYWAVIKARTFDLFRAYYSEDPEEVREFCRRNGISYLVVSEEDFKRERLMEGEIYFEPFGSHIRDYVGSRSRFAVLDMQVFPPVYHKDGIRVLKFRSLLPSGEKIGNSAHPSL